MKVVTILGARPQFIKASPVSRELKKAGIEEVIIHTGQHFDDNMSKVFFEEMGIPQPNYNLGIHSLSHGAMTGRMMESIEKILVEESPQYLIVYGDTNSTVAGALAAKKLHIPVAHIEAGLRSYNNSMPEEINRILTDRISDKLFCPTEVAVQNLQKEGFDNIDCEIVNTGDVMLDAFNHFSEISKGKSTVVDDLGMKGLDYILLTVHRQENTDADALERIKTIVRWLAKTTQVVWPVHPRVKDKVLELHSEEKVTLIEPQGYLDMISLLINSKLVVTDSGGLQKEAFFARKFCITLRAETEWTELVANGHNTLAGTDLEKAKKAFKRYQNMDFGDSINFYGNGLASKKIALSLRNN